MVNAIETTGILEPDGRIVIDEPLGVREPTSVRVIVLFEEELGEHEWLTAASKNAGFAFLEHPAEDIYASTDGKPLDG